jgi:hypothetical protein
VTTADGTQAQNGTGGPADAEPGPGWVLMPVAWCAWLLAWLVPSLLAAPHLETPRLWLTRDTAPAAVLAAVALFLVAVWPFWPAPSSGREGAAGRAVTGRWVGQSALELVMLIALASPFGLVAWSVGGRSALAGPLAAAAAAPAVFALGVRVAAAAMRQGLARWTMLAVTLLAVGPILFHYAAGETIGGAPGRILDASPVVSAVTLGLDGWPQDAWGWISVAFWPAAGVILGVLGWMVSAGRPCHQGRECCGGAL